MKTNLDPYRVAFDLVDEIPDDLLDILCAQYLKGAARLMGPARELHEVIADVLITEQRRRRDGAEPSRVVVALPMVDALTDAEVNTIRDTAQRLRNHPVRSVAALFGAIVEVLRRREPTALVHRQNAQLN